MIYLEKEPCSQKLCTSARLDTLPNDKNLDRFKLKDIADDKTNVTKKTELYFVKGRKHVDKAITHIPTVFFYTYGELSTIFI